MAACEYICMYNSVCDCVCICARACPCLLVCVSVWGKVYPSKVILTSFTADFSVSL